MVDVLSRDECRRIIAVAEAVGYSPDEPVGARVRPLESGGGGGGGAEAAAVDETPRAAALVWLADEALNDALFERCRPLLPPMLGGGALAGINARWRLYRYSEGAVYRPHVDGAWPGSGLVDGKLEYDAYGDRCVLTFALPLHTVHLLC